VYSWFDIVLQKKCKVCGYVIMPNHLHLLIYIGEVSPNLNYLIATSKRFMAYKLVNRLEQMNRVDMLTLLQDSVRPSEKKKGKKHKVFRQSFDAKECFSIGMVQQKLDYIHANPVSGKWSLVNDFTDYSHSSASFYELGIENKYIAHYRDVWD
jgi:REP element-mobilizing transposase RayT